MQGPAMQGLMGNYLEQSANAFIEMQRQMQSQTRNLFGNFPFPNFAAAGNPFATPAAAAAARPNADTPKDEEGGKSS
jgi:polyhydroxyalkanoate synthesis regulator protein